jgi:HTH-type transcriptional regulator / antitoxin HigA
VGEATQDVRRSLAAWRAGNSKRLADPPCRPSDRSWLADNPHALQAWRQRVITRAVQEKQLPAWERSLVNEGFLRWLVSLSSLSDGPRLALEALEAKGIATIIEARLDRTLLDGAAMLTHDGRPVIGLTLRHNRFDNFWFTLLHELGHVMLHQSPERPDLFDSEIDREKTESIEKEADQYALDHLIAPDVWQELRHLRSVPTIRQAAGRLGISPAIIAGRLRREAKDYRKHPTLIGNGQLRAVFGFTETTWPK